MPEHIMRWPSKWSNGFTGWHLECSAMSVKYLGEKFDIHGGGMDLIFPHHECEIAQNVAASGHETVKYWIHNNMITINGQKMARSLNNFITLADLFAGSNKVLSQAYSPMTIRFFILQAHYRSTVDFSNEALQAAGKGFQRLMAAGKTLQVLKTSEKSSFDVNEIEKNCYTALNDDLNSAILISHLMEAVRIINSIKDGKDTISKSDLEKLTSLYNSFVTDILGLIDESTAGDKSDVIEGLLSLVNSMRQKAKTAKDFETSDRIRNELNKLGIEIKDTKDGFEWKMK
jgi:cysteinyl-tRNA synthetase